MVSLSIGYGFRKRHALMDESHVSTYPFSLRTQNRAMMRADLFSVRNVSPGGYVFA
jgi:hypothetical protein